MKSVIASVIPTSLGGTLDESTLSPEQKKMLEAQKQTNVGMKAGGKVKASSASKRADGIAQRGKTRGRMI
jgi:hypothetical protein